MREVPALTGRRLAAGRMILLETLPHDGTERIMAGNSPTGRALAASPPTQVFSALSDPIRWSIIAQAASVDELAAVTLESTLSVAKPTISYHIKILQNAGLISTRKAGRNYYYTLRRDVIEEVADVLWELAPTPRPVIGTQKGRATRRRPSHPAPAPEVRRPAASRRRAVNDDVEEAVVLTW